MSDTPRPNLLVPELLQGTWTTALISTFGADLTFFETRLLRQLAQVPLRLVLADNDRLEAKLLEAGRTGKLHREANRTYVAAPIRHRFAAHGKMILLLGPRTGRLIVGSGNLGYEGYASPGELWHVFAYSDDEPRHANEFAAARAYFEELCERQSLDPPAAEILRKSWDTAPWIPPTPSGPTSIRSNLSQALIGQLRETITEPVDVLIAHAPFHDAECAALRELIAVCNPTTVRLLVTPSTSADPASIRAVLGEDTSRSVELIAVREEPSSYIHAKWVHLVHRETETLLSGSANLSRAALLRSSESGNIEVGVLSQGPRGAFQAIYEHLSLSKVTDDLASLGIRYDDAGPEQPALQANGPRVLWSRLDGRQLSITLDQEVAASTSIELEDHSGRPLTATAFEFSAEIVIVTLDQESAARVADGGRVCVRLEDVEGGDQYTWPYQMTSLRGRLDKASQRELLPLVGELPEQDAELLQLLHQLDETLIIDHESIWGIVQPDRTAEDVESDQSSVALKELDWDRVRRDPRYTGYLAGTLTSGLTPTDVQVVLAAISGRLGEIGMSSSGSGPSDDENLAHEGDTELSPDDEELDDELEDELIRRQLPVSTRTKMAYDRFIRRYASAVRDSAFLDEMGPIVAAINAVIFDHLLAQLLQRGIVNVPLAVDARVATWTLLWGGRDSQGIMVGASDETRGLIAARLDQARVRVTTLQGLTAAVEVAVDAQTHAALQQAARHLFVDSEFGLSSALLMQATDGDASVAEAMLDGMLHLAEPGSGEEILDYVLEPFAIARSAAHWETGEVMRAGSEYKARILVLGETIPGLTSSTARALLARVMAAAFFDGHSGDYIRARFKGNGNDVVFWDADAASGISLIGGEEEHFVEFVADFPDWERRRRDLLPDVQSHVSGFAAA